WAGNNDNSPMEKKIAAFIITPMWHEIMEYALQKYPSETFIPPAPEDLDTLPAVLRGSWNTNAAQGVHEILYWIDKDNPRSGNGGNSGDAQFARWEYPVSLWAEQIFASGQDGDGGAARRPLMGDRFRIISPATNAVFLPLSPIIFSAYHPRPDEISRVTYYVNGGYAGVSGQFPYSMSFIPQSSGMMQLRAVADTVAGVEEDSTIFVIQ
ncbi:MAG: Ig-like domain-containing protein, partial [Patescibacteria group bacterium]